MSPRNRVLDGHTHWRHLANTVEQLCMADVSASATRSGDTSCLIDWIKV